MLIFRGFSESATSSLNLQENKKSPKNTKKLRPNCQRRAGVIFIIRALSGAP